MVRFFLLQNPAFLLLLVTLEIGEFEAEVGGVMRFFLDFKLGELAAEEGGVFDFRAFLVGREIRFLRPWGTARGDFLFLLFDFALVLKEDSQQPLEPFFLTDL